MCHCRIKILRGQTTGGWSPPTGRITHVMETQVGGKKKKVEEAVQFTVEVIRGRCPSDLFVF